MGCRGLKPKMQKFGWLHLAQWFAQQRQWVLDRIEEVEWSWARDLLGNGGYGEACAPRLGSVKYAAGGNRAKVSRALRAMRVWCCARCTSLW